MKKLPGCYASLSPMNRFLAAGLALWLSLFSPPAQAARTARGERAMAATAHPLASEAAARVMEEGGTAADAFVAAALALGVVEPYSAGLGGGGFLIYRDAKGKIFAYDFRERAPAAAHRDLFIREEMPAPALSREGALSVAVPGQPAGLQEIHRRHGRLPRERLARDALKAAREGFEVFPYLREKIEASRERLSKSDASRRIWLPEGRAPRVGERVVQEGMARSLEVFAREGAAPFYKGEIARSLSAEIARLGGILTEADLAAYEVYEAEPLRVEFRGWEVVSFPPPSSGGVVLGQMLRMIEAAPDAGALAPRKGSPLLTLLRLPLLLGGTFSSPVGRLPVGSPLRRPAAVHLLAEVMRRAYADRAAHLGDPRFSRVPVGGLLSKDYAAARMAGFAPARAGEGAAGNPGGPPEGEHTTHLSIVGPEGDAVSATLTINLPFGSGITLPGWGIILNDEMDDFAAAPGTPNAFGLVQGEKNAVGGGRTPLSSMTPTLAFQGGRLRYVLGTPGGSRIISTVLGLFLQVAAFGADAEQAMDAPRIHHQWRPNRLFVEAGLADGAEGEEVIGALRRMGHEVEIVPPYCNAQAVWVGDDGALLGLSDERGVGEPAGF